MRRSPGFWIFALSLFAAFLALVLRAPGGHYHSFSQSALYLWAGQNPYGAPFNGGLYFYSPACAMFFGGIFAYLPPAWGQGLYVLACCAIWASGLVAFSRALSRHLNWDWTRAPGASLLWLMLSSELVGGILAVKLEVAIVGLMLWAFARLFDGRDFAAGLLLGIGLQWKLQPLPIVALTLLALAFHRRAWRAAAGVFSSAAILTALPLAFLTGEFARQVYLRWFETLATYTQEAWMAPIFQHVFRFLATVGVGVSRRTADVLSLLASGACAGVVVAMARAPRPVSSTLLVGLGLGSAYVVCFSPLSQSNAYILYTPLLFALWYFQPTPGSRVFLAVAGLAYFLISLAYSDLVPRAVYHFCYRTAVKPVGVSLLVVWLIASLRRPQSSLPEPP